MVRSFRFISKHFANSEVAKPRCDSRGRTRSSRAVLPLGPQLTAKSNRTGWRLERAREQEVVSTSRQRGLFTAVLRHSFPQRGVGGTSYFRRKRLRSVTAVSG